MPRTTPRRPARTTPGHGMRTFVHILVNTAVANLATSFLWFGLTFWIYAETSNVIASGAVGAAYMLFVSVCSMLFGTLVDRFDKKAVMVWATVFALGMFLIDLAFFAVAEGCNVQVTPLMKDDAEVKDLKDKFDGAVANHPEIERKPEIMVLRHTFVHSPDEPEAWRPAVEAVSRYYRTFSSWAFGKKTPENGFLDPQPLETVAERPEFDVDSLHKSAMIGTPEEVTARLKNYEDMGYDEYSYWIDNSMTHEEKKASLQLFIDQVVPNFR